MPTRPFLILDCYFDEKGAAPNFCALLGQEPREIIRAVTDELPANLGAYRGILISGSKANLPDPDPWMEPLFELIRGAHRTSVPVLGVCFGHQAIAAALAGLEAVRRAPRGELGWEEICVQEPNDITRGLPARFKCFVSHFDEVAPGTPGLNVFASSERCAVQAYQVQNRPMWGVQFHPEMDPGESETLVRNNLARHASLGGSAEDVLAKRRDGRDLGAVIFRNFIAICTALANQAGGAH